MIDDKDLLMLTMLYRKPSTSLTEMQAAIQCRSVATVYNRIVAMESLGLITPPPVKKQARSREITAKGIELLKANGIA
jgi:predicted transcriptional regulator